MGRLLWYSGHAPLIDIVKAEGCYLFDARGKRYVDLESGVWCTSIGHGHPRFLRALQEQSARFVHAGYCYSSAVVEDAAREILALLGFDDGRCVFLCSGSEAVEYGVRVAQMLSRRPLLLSMTDSYFGAYGSASKRQASEWFEFGWLEVGCSQCPDSMACRGNCEQWKSIPFDRIGGFLFEPGSSSGLVRFPPSKLIRAIVERIEGDGGFVLVNEVTTGVGRTGRWFGYEHYGIHPDVVAIGKGIGNGYPVSVAAFCPRVIEHLGDRSIPYAQSHQNDPLGAAIAREVVRTIRDEGLVERAAEIGIRLVEGLEAIRARTDRIQAIRARGLMVAVEVKDDAEPPAFAAQVFRRLLDRGFIVARRAGLNVLRIDPPMMIGEADIDAFLEAFEGALAG